MRRLVGSDRINRLVHRHRLQVDQGYSAEAAHDPVAEVRDAIRRHRTILSFDCERVGDDRHEDEREHVSEEPFALHSLELLGRRQVHLLEDREQECWSQQLVGL